MPFDVITDYIAQARILLQDVDPPYRYPDADLVSAFNIAIGESRRLRPDMWLGYTNSTLPAFYTAVASAEAAAAQETVELSYVPPALNNGMYALDVTTPQAIVVGTTVEEVLGAPTNSVTLSQDILVKVLDADVLAFSTTGTIPIDPQYQMAFVYFICGNAQMRDEEETQDTRAAAFMTMFKNTLVGAL